MNKQSMVIAVLVTLVGGGAACSQGSKMDGKPCDAATFTALEKSLETANGYGLDIADAKIKAQVEGQQKALTGKKYTLTGCKFAGQGGDVVMFSASTEVKADKGGGELTLECTMKGGEGAVKDFRHKAMEMHREKLRLDVSGELGIIDSGFKRLALKNCEIAVHE